MLLLLEYNDITIIFFHLEFYFSYVQTRESLQLSPGLTTLTHTFSFPDSGILPARPVIFFKKTEYLTYYIQNKMEQNLVMTDNCRMYKLLQA